MSSSEIPSRKNQYKGFRVPHNFPTNQTLYENFERNLAFPIESSFIDRWTSEKFCSKKLFYRYIKKRKPVVIDKSIVPNEFYELRKKFSNNFLNKIAGQSLIEVETAIKLSENTNHSYGHGKKKSGLSFSSFLEKIASGDSSIYLTTQEKKIQTLSNQPHISSSPVSELILQNELPLRPELIGNLIPENINMWMGNSPHGTSSGLHHDYHDNFYILLRGKKKISII